MKVISCNLNGIRSASNKGFWSWFARQDADTLCLQELRAHSDQIPPEALPNGYHQYFNFASKKGYSGVAVYTKTKPLGVRNSLNMPDMDDEGRYLELEFHNYIIASLYLPSGSSGEHRQIKKYACMDAFFEHLKQLKQQPKPVIIAGDYNIAHKEIDIKNWKGNLKNSGFLPEERAWMDQVFSPEFYLDAFRAVNQEPDQYTWWSNRGRAYEKNVGWRIDYQVVSPELKESIMSAEIYKEEKFSDHAPLIMTYGNLQN